MKEKGGFWRGVGNFAIDHPVITMLTVTSIVGSITGCISRIHENKTMAKMPDSYWEAKKVENEARKCEIRIE